MGWNSVTVDTPSQIPGTTWQDHRKGPHSPNRGISANCLAANSTETQLASGSEAGTVNFFIHSQTGDHSSRSYDQDGANLTGQYDFKIPVQTIAWRRSTTQVGLTLVDVESVPPRGSAALLDASTQSRFMAQRSASGHPVVRGVQSGWIGFCQRCGRLDRGIHQQSGRFRSKSIGPGPARARTHEIHRCTRQVRHAPAGLPNRSTRTK